MTPDFSGIAEVFSSPLQTIREDFGTARVDQTFSAKDTFSAIYTIDDGGDVTATTANPYSTDILNLREQVLSLEETHIFSPALLNVARFGYSRAGYYFTGEPTPGTPAARRSRLSRRTPRGCRGGRGQRGFQSASASWFGRKQQRKQLADQAKSVHV